MVTITQSLKGHGILGTDVRDIHAQKDRWLAEDPSIKIIDDGDIKRDPQCPQMRFGGKRAALFLFLRYREEASGRDASGISISAAAQRKGKTDR